MADAAAGSNEITIRKATPRDIQEILCQRRRMYEDMGSTDSAALEAMCSLSARYLEKTMLDGSFRAWLAFLGQIPVGGAALILSPWLAHPYDLECRRATILNVYIYPEFRRRGIARRLMEEVIGWCRRKGLAGVTLHSSDDGRHLYESLGFEASNEMRLKLR
jgi:ribosomal protein S18 acetylase RimI-like enzyme